MTTPTRLQALSKFVNFYARFTPSFTRVGFIARGLPFRPVGQNLKGQNWLVTGATGGIGRAIALLAATNGARVFAVGRNEIALAKLLQESERLNGSIVPVKCELDSISAISRLANGWAEDHNTTIDVLVNNVGILNRDFSRTIEGFETTYATNLLGHFVLTEELYRNNQIASGAAIVNVVSGGLFNAPLNDDRIDMAPENFNGFIAYASHKRGQLALADLWRDNFAEKSIKTYAVHPGWVDTAGVKISLPRFRKVLAPILRNAKEGADTAYWLGAVRPEEARDKVWFDRKARSAHAYPHTKIPAVTPAQLAEYLSKDFTRIS